MSKKAGLIDISEMHFHFNLSDKKMYHLVFNQAYISHIHLGIFVNRVLSPRNLQSCYS